MYICIHIYVYISLSLYIYIYIVGGARLRRGGEGDLLSSAAAARLLLPLDVSGVEERSPKPRREECHDIPGASTHCLMFEVSWHLEVSWLSHNKVAQS